MKLFLVAEIVCFCLGVVSCILEAYFYKHEEYQVVHELDHIAVNLFIAGILFGLARL